MMSYAIASHSSFIGTHTTFHFHCFFLFLNENPHEERPPWIAFLEPDAMPGIEQEHNKILLNGTALCNKNLFARCTFCSGLSF